MRSSSGPAVILVLALAAAACQPLPQPFAELRPAHNPLLVLPDSVGVTLPPISGLDGPSNDAIANALVTQLQERNVPAMRDGGTRASYVLAAAASQAPANASGVVATAVTWHLVQDGKTFLVIERRLRLKNGAPLPDDVPMLAAIAADVARVMQAESPAAIAGSGPPPAMRIAVPEIDGAPGDGSRSLAAAMTGFLRSKGLRADPASAAKEGALKLAGMVTISRPLNGQQTVEIVWSLIDTKGREIGNVRQRNPVPAGSLDGKWGEIADFAAEAAADGVLALIDQAQRSPASGL